MKNDNAGDNTLLIILNNKTKQNEDINGCKKLKIKRGSKFKILKNDPINTNPIGWPPTPEKSNWETTPSIAINCIYKSLEAVFFEIKKGRSKNIKLPQIIYLFFSIYFLYKYNIIQIYN